MCNFETKYVRIVIVSTPKSSSPYAQILIRRHHARQLLLITVHCELTLKFALTLHVLWVQYL